MAERPLRELLQRAAAGDDEAFDQLVERYSDLLLGRIRMMMGPQARRTAESIDVQQQVYQAMIENIDRLREFDDQRLKQWLTTTARHRVQRAVHRRRERAFDSLSTPSRAFEPGPGEEPLPAEQLMRREQLEMLEQGMAALSEDYREVIRLRNFDQRSFREIGERMGRSEDAAQMLHKRAIERVITWHRARGAEEG